MKIKTSLWLKAALVLLFGFSSAFATSIQSADTTPPQLVSLGISPTLVNVGSADATITITARITDNLAGNAGAGYSSSPSQISFKSPSGNQIVYAMLDEGSRVSGTALDGNYSYQMVVPRYAESGTWSVDSVLLVDQIGNSKYESAQTLSTRSLPKSFNVVGPSETMDAYNIRIDLEFHEVKAIMGKVLRLQLQASGGSGPFVWVQTDGNLPAGVALSSNGAFSGTPTTPGNYKFTIKVTNAEGFSAYQSLQIRVIPPSTFGGGYNFANFAGSPVGFSGSSDASFLGSGAASGGFTGSADGRTGFTGSADSASSKPLLYAPAGVAVDASGNIYVSDTANNQIRKISATGAISNVAGVFTGSGGEDGTAWNARFNNPQGMDTDASGNVYVADQDNHAIRRITPIRAVSTVAGSFTGSGAAGFSGSADGGGKTTARFNKPADVAVDAAGNIYVADSGNHAIRKISTNGTVTTLAGTMGAAGNTNATGASARFRTPQGIAVDGNGTVYVADTGNQVIRRITANGAVSTFAGAAFTGSASPRGGRASFTGSAHAAFIGSADSTNLPASVDGNATTARFSYPTDIAIDSAGNLYVTDSGTEKVRRITANGTVTTLGGSPDGFFYNPLAVAAGANGTLYVADAGNNRIARGIPGTSAIAAPVIITEPNDFIDVYGNTSANFSVTATGANLTYQWYRNGIPVSGANAPTLLRTASPITEGIYTVAVSNVLATEFSEPATLSLRPPAEWDWGQTVTEQPVRPGDSVTFSVDNVTGPGGNISYQWLRNGKPLPGKTAPTLTLSNIALADGGNYALAITTSAGKITSEFQTLVVQDQSPLVYRFRGIGTTASAKGKESTKLEGYLVRDRTNNYSYLFWLWPATKDGGGSKTYSFESRTDITEKSTGPFNGSTSVLRAHMETDGPDLAWRSEEMVWISGTDSLITLSPALKTLAPATMSGQINATYPEQGMIIDMTNLTLTLDRPQTLKARTTDNNDIAAATLNRLMQEIESKGYQMSN
jgi:sugar lactone lactonase YvrE